MSLWFAQGTAKCKNTKQYDIIEHISENDLFIGEWKHTHPMAPTSTWHPYLTNQIY